MNTNTNVGNELGTEELDLVSGGWFPGLQMASTSTVLKDTKDAGQQYKDLPSGWGNGTTGAPTDFHSMFPTIGVPL